MEKAFKHLKIRKVINASGRMTSLGVSTFSDQIAAAIKYGGQNYVHINELITQAGKEVADLIGAEDGLIVSSAAAGIAMAVAGLIHQGKQIYIQNPLKSIIDFNLPNEIILLKGQNVDFGAPIETMIQLGGGKVVEVGWANLCTLQHIEDAVTEKTKGILFVKSHHAVQKSMPNVEVVIKLAKKLKIPLIIDAAAEEDLAYYNKTLSTDIVIFSGAKAIEGPTSGIIVGKKTYINNIKKEIYGLGRAMKIGKENIYGQLMALQNYITNYYQRDKPNWNQKLLENFINSINKLDNLKCELEQEKSIRKINRAKMSVKDSNKFTISDIVRALEAKSPSIVTRKHRQNEGIIYFDPRPMKDSDYDLVIVKLKQIVKELL